MEIRQTETGKIAICHHCRTKRKLIKKSDTPKSEVTNTESNQPEPKEAQPQKAQSQQAQSQQAQSQKTGSNEAVPKKARSQKARPKKADSQKSASPRKQTYSNIPDKNVRRKSEKEVRQNYQQMLNADDDADRPRRKQKKSGVGRIISILLVIILLAVGAFFGYKYYQEYNANHKQSSNDNEQSPPAQTDSIDINTGEFSVDYIRHETNTDADGYPCLLVYYTYTNLRKDSSSSAVADVYLTASQNGSVCADATPAETHEEVTNAAKEVDANESVTVCQVFSLAATSDVTLNIYELLDSSNTVLGEKVISIE